MTPQRRRAIVRTMRTVAALGSCVVLGACVAVAFAPIPAAVVGTLACALVASAALYAAFEGFDEALRRGP
ncbi:MAG: hypothetical protein NVS2B8_05540 [Vulcanimicrobiaceae bacterium]